MTNQQLLTERPDDLRPDPPAPASRARGFLDCRGEWHDLDDEEDRDAPA